MRFAAVLLAVSVLLVVPATPAVVAQDDAPAESAVSIEVSLESDGAAHWNVSARFSLDSENETAAFRRLAERFEDGETGADLGFDEQTFRALANESSQRTGREMRITDPERAAHVVGPADNATGFVSMTFTWTNFTRVSGQTIRLGDAFGTGWRLAADQRLVVHPPPNYGIIDSSPVPTKGPNDGVLVWAGPRQFSDGGPSVTYVQGVTPSTQTTTTTTTPPTEEGLFDGAGGLAAVVLSALVVGGLVAYALARRPRDEDDGDVVATETAAEADAAASNGGTGTGPGEAAEDGSDTVPDTSTNGEAAAPIDPDGDVDPELLSDEERVERLLAHNGGRMKQANIVTETGWSNAKVSQLLSTMDDDDRIDKLRIGRENLITLAGEDAPADGE